MLIVPAREGEVSSISVTLIGVSAVWVGGAAVLMRTAQQAHDLR